MVDRAAGRDDDHPFDWLLAGSRLGCGGQRGEGRGDSDQGEIQRGQKAARGLHGGGFGKVEQRKRSVAEREAAQGRCLQSPRFRGHARAP